MDEEPLPLLVAFHHDAYTLVDRTGHVVRVLHEGETVDLWIQHDWQPVQVARSGYSGWYYIQPDGQLARFALAMKAH